MTATFPGGVVPVTTKSEGDEFDEGLMNVPQDELVALEGAVIGGFSRGGPLDCLMGSDPGLNQQHNGGAAYLVYEGASSRYNCSVVGDTGAPIRAVYKVLPTALQITPSPKARVKLGIEFMIQEDSSTLGIVELCVGLLNGTENTDTLRSHLGLFLTMEEGVRTLNASVGGLTTATQMSLGSPAVGTRYRAEIEWQIDRATTLSAALYNATTGAVVTAKAYTAVTVSGTKNAQLPHLGIRFRADADDVGGVVYVYDVYARIVRG